MATDKEILAFYNKTTKAELFEIIHQWAELKAVDSEKDWFDHVLEEANALAHAGMLNKKHIKVETKPDQDQEPSTKNVVPLTELYRTATADNDYNSREIPHSPKYWENEKLSEGPDHNDRCIVCNKPLNNEGKFFLHMKTNGRMVPFGIELPEHEDQGAFPIGNECQKKIPTAYKQKC